MVAVVDKISKAQKLIPATLTWDGKVETFEAFYDLFEEWISIRLGDDAAAVLKGTVQNEHGDEIMNPCLYATWSQEIYLLLRGRLTKSPEATAVGESTVEVRAALGRSAFNLVTFWRKRGEATALRKREIDVVSPDGASTAPAHKSERPHTVR